MDYQFYRDMGNTPSATSEIAAFGDWLTHDLGSDAVKIDHIVATVNALQSDEQKHAEIIGADYRLTLNQDEVEIEALFVGFADEDNLPEGTEFEEPLMEGCGLEDFQRLLLAWRDFIRK